MGVKTQKCVCCGKEKPATRDYFKSSSSLYKSDRMLICKSCIEKYYNQLLNNYDNNIELAFEHLCLTLDCLYSKELLSQCIQEFPDSYFGNYFRLLNCKKEYKNLSGINNIISSSGTSKNIQIDDDVINEKILDFWGKGFSSQEYRRLEQKYREYIRDYPSERRQEVTLIKTIAILEVLRERTIINNDSQAFDKYTTQISKRMEELNVLPNKMQKYNDDENITVGTMLQMIETKEPIPDKNPAYTDVDGIRKIMNRYFFNPIRKIINNDETPYTEEDEKWT